MKISKIFIVLILLCADLQLFAGAWTQKSGAGFYKLDLRYLNTSQYYDKDGNKIEIPTLTDVFVAFYGEYGLNDQFTIIANIGLLQNIHVKKHTNTIGTVIPSYINSNIADSEIGLRYGFWKQGNSVFSTELLLGLPIGDNKDDLFLYTGDGEFNQTLNFQFGHSFYPDPFYLSSQVGFNNRNEGYSDEFKYAAEFGYSFSEQMLIAFKIHGVETMNNGDETVFGGYAGLYANDRKYLAFGPELVYAINNSLGFSVAVESAVHTANVPSALAFSLGIYFKN